MRQPFHRCYLLLMMEMSWQRMDINYLRPMQHHRLLMQRFLTIPPVGNLIKSADVISFLGIKTAFISNSFAVYRVAPSSWTGWLSWRSYFCWRICFWGQKSFHHQVKLPIVLRRLFITRIITLRISGVRVFWCRCVPCSEHLAARFGWPCWRGRA